MDDLYTVGYVVGENTTVQEVHVCGPVHLAAILNIFENGNVVSRFKVTSSGMAMDPEMFGFGDYKKWVHILFPKGGMT